MGRVADYENALIRSPSSHREGPAFTIVGERGAPGPDDSSPILEFPNEVLTHILSHLPPATLSAVALVSQRFHALVTTPHAWRLAFSRFFPGPDASSTAVQRIQKGKYGAEELRSEQRMFMRLTALASWRSEYILRTRLLRSLARGKPGQTGVKLGPSNSTRPTPHHPGNAAITYSSQLLATVNHLHASFGEGSSKRVPRFIHGSDEIGSACCSDPSTAKVDNWGFSDPQSFLQFVERFPGDAQWGLGVGDVLGVPNVMDLSQPFGVVYGEGSPGGLAYFRSTDELRGRFLASSTHESVPELGIPEISGAGDCICSVWIAKSAGVLLMTDGLVGIMSGSARGVVSAYSMGTDGLRDHRLGRGEVTARWVLSPGVPIIAIGVDEFYNSKRKARDRICAVALNALGEVFYLRDLPKRRPGARDAKLDERGLDRLAWQTGRSAYWSLVAPSRRKARGNLLGESGADDSYSPRSSWDGTGLTKEQIVAETREIEAYLRYKPSHFRKVCGNWDLRRRLEIDFAGDDDHGAGESIIVVTCGLEEGAAADIKRFTKGRAMQRKGLGISPSGRATSTRTPIFGSTTSSVETSRRPSTSQSPSQPGSRSSSSEAQTRVRASNEDRWLTTMFAFEPYRAEQITTTAIDCSNFAVLSAFEDPLLGMCGFSTASSPVATPPQHQVKQSCPSEIPGHRGRLFAAGSRTGMIFIWNMRGPTSSNPELVNTLSPVRVIRTDSPQISSLALTALYLVHGGNDGLVQAWDPLASNLQPIRTLNSRFSSRARRRLVQAESTTQGVGINLFAAGAISLDPNPTVLRGMVSLGAHLRFWSYSSSAADQYASRKRRLRRSARGSNANGDRFSGTGRGALEDYITNEKVELEREKEKNRREANRLASRFGIGLLGPGASEAELLEYARMLSEETFAQDEERRRSGSEDVSGGSLDGRSSETVTPEGSTTGPPSPALAAERGVDSDVAEAIRLSLEVNSVPGKRGQSCGIPFKYVQGRRSPSSSPPRETLASKVDNDLDFALQLSLAEEQSRKAAEAEAEMFPELSEAQPKGNGKRRAS